MKRALLMILFSLACVPQEGGTDTDVTGETTRTFETTAGPSCDEADSCREDAKQEALECISDNGLVHTCEIIPFVSDCFIDYMDEYLSCGRPDCEGTLPNSENIQICFQKAKDCTDNCVGDAGDLCEAIYKECWSKIPNGHFT